MRPFVARTPQRTAPAFAWLFHERLTSRPCGTLTGRRPSRAPQMHSLGRRPSLGSNRLAAQRRWYSHMPSPRFGHSWNPRQDVCSVRFELRVQRLNPASKRSRQRNAVLLAATMPCTRGATRPLGPLRRGSGLMRGLRPCGLPAPHRRRVRCSLLLLRRRRRTHLVSCRILRHPSRRCHRPCRLQPGLSIDAPYEAASSPQVSECMSE